MCSQACSFPRTATVVSQYFYRYSGHIELIRFKEYYGMPRGHKHILIFSLSINARLSGTVVQGLEGCVSDV